MIMDKNVIKTIMLTSQFYYNIFCNNLKKDSKDSKCKCKYSNSSKQKDPESWNYVTPSGKRFIAEYVEALFKDNLYGEFKEMCSEDSKLQTAAYAWCEMHGVSIDYADTIRQRFYRERERLLACGVDLRKRSRTKNEKKS